MDLLAPLEPLTRKQKTIAWIAAFVCAGSRFLAMAHTLWDWDEALFCLGMRSYDVTSHHPHPPGFPVYIALGHLSRLLFHDDFRALQAINLLAGALLFPAMLLLARELRLRFDVAMVASLLLLFFPNVWIFGGTAFSDIPSLTLVVFAIAMLIRGCRDRSAYFIGTFALALSIGIRPQNLLIGLWPGIVATRFRAKDSLRDVFAAAAIGIVVVGAAFAGAIAATGPLSAWLNTVRGHGEYISKIDSFRNPDRPPLWRIFDRFFFKQYESMPLSIITSIFVLISAVGATRSRDRRIGMIALAFAPFALSAWMMLDRFSINRFSIGYIPLFAILAADGIERTVHRRPRLTPAVGGALVIAFVAYGWPALAIVRDTVTPTVAGVGAARQRLDPARDQLYVGTAMVPFMEYLAPEMQWTRLIDERGIPLSPPRKRAWLLTEIDRTRPAGYLFTREHERLWNIVRRHYFDVALEPLRASAEFGAGWYQAERDGREESRWMGSRSTTVLPPATGESVLRLVYEIPNELLPLHPTVTVRLNGAVIERLRLIETYQTRDYNVMPAKHGAPNVLVLEIDRTFNPLRQHTGDDPRDLGILLHLLGWGAR